MSELTLCLSCLWNIHETPACHLAYHNANKQRTIVGGFQKDQSASPIKLHTSRFVCLYICFDSILHTCCRLWAVVQINGVPILKTESSPHCQCGLIEHSERLILLPHLPVKYEAKAKRCLA